MNKKAEFNLQGMLYGALLVGLIAGVFSSIFLLLGPGYDFTGNIDDIQKYDYSENLSATVQTVSEQVDNVEIDRNWFDFFSGIWNKLTSPFKFVYRSFSIVKNLGGSAVQDLNLLPVFSEFVATLITIFVIVGIVLIKFFLARKK